LKHVFYFDGDAKKISWVIKTENSTVKQSREHAEIYLDKVNNIQSKYIALHVGLFWAIGTFIIKNEDIVIVMLEDKSMYEHLSLKKKNEDEFIERRTDFINRLILQRKLKINYKMSSKEEENIASR
jgi:hypothetical protein